MICSSTQVIASLLCCSLIYALSFLPMSGKGPRTLLSLLIPFFWTLGLIMHLPSIESAVDTGRYTRNLDNGTFP